MTPFPAFRLLSGKELGKGRKVVYPVRLDSLAITNHRAIGLLCQDLMFFYGSLSEPGDSNPRQTWRFPCG